MFAFHECDTPSYQLLQLHPRIRNVQLLRHTSRAIVYHSISYDSTKCCGSVCIHFFGLLVLGLNFSYPFICFSETWYSVLERMKGQGRKQICYYNKFNLLYNQQPKFVFSTFFTKLGSKHLINLDILKTIGTNLTAVITNMWSEKRTRNL